MANRDTLENETKHFDIENEELMFGDYSQRLHEGLRKELVKRLPKLDYERDIVDIERNIETIDKIWRNELPPEEEDAYFPIEDSLALILDGYVEG